jgi:cationic peptide transport system substrate-binding protein
MRYIPIYFSLFLLSACYQTESTMSDSLIYCTAKAPKSFNPQISHDVATLDATTHQLYNRLVKLDPISQRFSADIASHWEVNDAKTEYTFYLRKDVNFHHTAYFKPSRQLNADDIIFSFKRMLSQSHPFYSINNALNNELYNRPFSDLVGDIIKIDQYTIRFLLNKPNATLLANLAAHYAVIHSQEYGQQLLQESHPEKIDYSPIGTGPYQFKSITNNRVIRYQAHRAPWQAPANINNLIFDITPNSSKRYAKLLSGECDIMTNPASSQVDQMSKNPRIALSSKHTDNISLIALNSKKAPFNDIAIRHALSEAIDLNTILNAVFFETAISTQNLLPEHSWAYNPRIAKAIYAPQESLIQLKKNNFDFSQTIRILAPAKNSIFNPNFYKTAELIQANWADIGVKSVIILLHATELNEVLSKGDYDIYLTGRDPYIKDPDNLFRPLLSCNASPLEGNTSQWCDAQVQSLLDTTLLEVNFIQRVKSYYQLQEYIQAQRIYQPIAHMLRFDVFNKHISNLQVNSLTGINFQFVKKDNVINKEETQ